MYFCLLLPRFHHLFPFYSMETWSGITQNKAILTVLINYKIRVIELFLSRVFHIPRSRKLRFGLNTLTYVCANIWNQFYLDSLRKIWQNLKFMHYWKTTFWKNICNNYLFDAVFWLIYFNSFVWGFQKYWVTLILVTSLFIYLCVIETSFSTSGFLYPYLDLTIPPVGFV